MNFGNVQTFKGNCFSFSYPENWRVFKVEGFKKDIKVRIGPKSGISKQYMAIEELTSDGTGKAARFISLEKDIDSIKPKYHKYINENLILEFSFYQFDISVTKMANNGLSSIMSKRKERIKSSSNIKRRIKKVSENHYINKLTIDGNLYNEGSNNSKLSHTMHYYHKNEFLYTLAFTSKTEEKSEYTDVSKLIFDTFKFKQFTCIE
jgi:hypothetical protein